MATLTILAGHPFFRYAAPAVWQQSWDRQWTVRWRDFYGVKQDAVFATELAARAFAATINQPPLLVDDDNGCDLAQCDRWWRDLARVE